jgi:predicted AAA+ superfamily ATPase
VNEPTGLRPRRLLEVVSQRVADEPVVILTGPRTVGKSTLLAALSRELDRPVFDLDQPDARAAASVDPGFLVSGPAPVLVDEFQHVPEILDAIKAELNRDTRPGRFVLTGSTRYTVLPQAAQSLTGRAHVINVLPLSQGELDGHRESFIDLLWQDPERIPPAAASACSRDEYVNRILSGGFPMILQRRTARARTSWFADYVDLVVMRDVLDIARIRQREALPRLLRQFAAQTGQLLNITKAGQAIGLESSTANRYATLLEAAFMIQRMPAWGETLGKRLSAHPKVHIIDSGLAGWLLGLSVAKINSRNPAALTEFGHLVETFAVGEILKQVSWAEELITASHFRTEAGDEVDLVLETWDGRVAGFEIKAGTRIKDPDLSGLRLLRDRLGDRFVGGFILNLGELAYRKEAKIAVMPLSALWSLPASSSVSPSGDTNPSSANQRDAHTELAHGHTLECAPIYY